MIDFGKQYILHGKKEMVVFSTRGWKNGKQYIVRKYGDKWAVYIRVSRNNTDALWGASRFLYKKFFNGTLQECKIWCKSSLQKQEKDRPLWAT